MTSRSGRIHASMEAGPVDSLAAAAARAGKRVGTAVAQEPFESDPVYREILATEFSAITPENVTKWGPLQPTSPKRWSFAAADAMVRFACEEGQEVKGHALVWHQQLPTWITDDIESRELAKAARKHIRKAVGRYRKHVEGWDVVNEALDEDGSLRESIFSERFGASYIPQAFWHAHRADRDALLYYNDYNIDTRNAKSDGAFALMSDLLAARVPVDGIGFQMHLDAANPPSVEAMTDNFARFAELGLSLNISELDVRIADVAGWPAERLAAQKRVYHHAVAACVREPACDTVTTWGFTDRHSWIDTTFGPDDPLMFDAAYQRKPAYYGMVDAFMGIEPDPYDVPANLLPNGSFEIGADGWVPFGEVTIETAEGAADGGERSGRASGRTASWNGIAHGMDAFAAPGRTYEIGTSVSIQGAATADVALTVQLTCEGEDTRYVQLAHATASEGSWTELAGSLTLPDCAIQSSLFYVEGAPAGVDLLVDGAAVRMQPVPPAVNLVANPGFEDGTAGWVAWGGATIATTDIEARSGSWSGRVSGRTADWQGAVYSLTGLVEPGQTYDASAWGRLLGASSDAGRLTARVTCAGVETYTTLASGTFGDSGWTQLTGALAVPDCALDDVVVYVEGPQAGVDLLVDDVVVSPIEEPDGPQIVVESDFEGDASGWQAWGGATIEVTTEQAHGGASSAVVRSRNASWQGPVYDLRSALDGGEAYDIGAWLRLGGADGRPVYLTAQVQCEGETLEYRRLAEISGTDAAWTEMVGVLEVPACALSTLVVYAEGPDAGVDLYIDDFRVVTRP